MCVIRRIVVSEKALVEPYLLISLIVSEEISPLVLVTEVALWLIAHCAKCSTNVPYASACRQCSLHPTGLKKGTIHALNKCPISMIYRETEVFVRVGSCGFVDRPCFSGQTERSTKITR